MTQPRVDRAVRIYGLPLLRQPATVGVVARQCPAAELANTPPDCSIVFVVENEITYLAFPPPEGSVVIFGGGICAIKCVLQTLHHH